MKRLSLVLVGFAVMLICLTPIIAAERLNPFGLVLDQAFYENILDQLKQNLFTGQAQKHGRAQNPLPVL